MSRTIDVTIDAPASRVFDVLGDLGTYPLWLDIVARAEVATPHCDDLGPAWWVTLRARVGPLSRSKRLRMVRSVERAPSQLRFERNEVDGRNHSDWVLNVRIEGTTATNVTVELRYDGRLWTSPLELVLGRQVDDAVPRLQALVAGA